ncbi:MAG: YceI family protein [Pseudomonadota bacterium]
MNTRRCSRYTYLLLALLGAIPALSCAEPARYSIDSDHTHVRWEVDRFGFARTMGSFTQVKGNIWFGPDDIRASTVDAEIVLASLRSDLLEREEIVRGKHWLKADQYPLISFSSKQVSADTTNPKKFSVTGAITLAGVTRPLTLAVTLNKVGTDPVTRRPAIGISASGAFNRSDFGIKIALGPIGDEVSFRIESMAVAAASD